MRSQDNLVRKQYLVSKRNIEKIEKLASARDTSAAEIVRQAIDAYDPHGGEEMSTPELMELVSAKLKETIISTKRARQKVSKALKTLDVVKS